MNRWNQQTGYEVDTEDDRLYPQRSPSSTIRFRPLDTGATPLQPVIYQRRQLRTPNQYDEVNYFIRTRSRPQGVRTTQERPPRHRQEAEADTNEPETNPPGRTRRRPALSRLDRSGYVGLGMLVVVVLLVLLVLVLNWWSGVQDDLHYGHPRTFQTDASVGHHDTHTPSHFIALNLNHQVEVIEFPGGDASHAKIYLGPTLSGNDSALEVVTVSFKDVNGDGKTDMIVTVEGGTYLFINDNGAFRTVRSDDHVKM